MKVSVFTPTHDSRFLLDCYRSLEQQSLSDWEWVVVPNGGVALPEPLLADPRVVIRPTESKSIGALKAFAVEQTTGDLIVELDHDDWLLPDCLMELAAAAEHSPNAALFYSDFAYIDAGGMPSPFRYEGRWIYSSEEVYGRMYHRCHAQAATPENVAVIWYAPNHVRAFTRQSYDAAGGYDPAYAVLDDQDLMTRLFLVGEFVHVDRMLYLQRMHDANTQVDRIKNAEIQRRTVEIYKERVGPMTEAYVQRLLAANREEVGR